MAGTIKSTYDKKIIDNINGFFDGSHGVKIGILSNAWKENPDGKHSSKFGPVALAMVHEFGSKKRRIPERSFLRQTLQFRKIEFMSRVEKAADLLMRNLIARKYDKVLNDFGAIWKDYVHEAFEAGGPGWAALKQRTLDGRTKHLLTNASGKPILSSLGKKQYEASKKILWDTGAMLRSITWEIFHQ